MGVLLAHSHPAVSAFPERGIGSACTSSFSRIAQRSLTLLPARSRGHLCVTRYPKASDISSPPCLLRLLPAGAMSPGGPRTHWKAPPCHRAPPEQDIDRKIVLHGGAQDSFEAGIVRRAVRFLGEDDTDADRARRFLPVGDDI